MDKIVYGRKYFFVFRVFNANSLIHPTRMIYLLKLSKEVLK